MVLTMYDRIVNLIRKRTNFFYEYKLPYVINNFKVQIFQKISEIYILFFPFFVNKNSILLNKLRTKGPKLYNYQNFKLIFISFILS